MSSATDTSYPEVRALRQKLTASPTTWEVVEAVHDYAISRARSGAPTTEIRLRLTERGVPPRVAAGLAGVASRSRPTPPRGRWAGWRQNMILCALLGALAWQLGTGWWILPRTAQAADGTNIQSRS